jgi:pSer/pThr/pTyr-binding forkhead associated (FHA) protein
VIVFIRSVYFCKTTVLKSVITITLLHPTAATTIQTWQFRSESIIRIGRSGDNDVILYSSVVSRYHAELHPQTLGWEIINIGANGTYIDNRQIDKELIKDKITIYLSPAGPKLQILYEFDLGDC